MKTVADFKRYAIGLANVNDLGEFVSVASDKNQIIRRIQFVECLNNIGAQNTHGKEYDTKANIDETVELSDDEWGSLEAELLYLLGMQ